VVDSYEHDNVQACWIKVGNFLTNWGSITFSRITLHSGFCQSVVYIVIMYDIGW